MVGLPGISAGGEGAEARFLALTGALRAERAALGDALLDGHYIEVKQANSQTLNQVRAVKYITLVAYQVPEKRWFVVPASEVVRQCANKGRGQHTENPFESATLSLGNLQDYGIESEIDLRDACLAAIAEAQRYPRLAALMTTVLADSKALAAHSIAQVHVALKESGLS